MLRKRIISIELCLSILFAICVMPIRTYASQEADTSLSDIYEEKYYENAFKFYSTGTYPEDVEGKIFAGWYQKSNPSNPVCRSEDFSEGGAYARFVDADVLGAKWQVTKGTTSDWNTTALRLVSTVDSLCYRSVGFSFTVNDKTKTLISNTVYKKIMADGELYTPSETFCSASRYFTIFEITEVPNSVFGTGIKVEPVWTTMDGTVVTGKTKTVVIYSSMKDEFVDTLSYGEVWSAPSTVKVAKDEAYTNKGDMALSYQAVRNEYESCQLFITATEEVSSFELFATDLKCGEEAVLVENIDVYVEKSIHYNDYYGTGSMPDALLPLDAADAHKENEITTGENGALWVTVYIPKETKAGVYEGDFLLAVEAAGGKEFIKIPVSLEVLDYTLTDERNARTLFSWRYERVSAGELDGSLEMMKYYYEFFQDYRISLQSLPLGTLSSEEYALNVQKYYDELSSYCILSRIGDVSGDLLSEQDSVKEQILAIAASSTIDKNLFDKAMIYFIDEPDLTNADKRAEVVSKIAQLNEVLQNCINDIQDNVSGIYAEFKEIENWQASILDIPQIIPIGNLEWLVQNESADGMQELLEAVNCLCPIYSSFTEELSEQVISLLAKYKIRMWWYGCTNPKSPAPTYHIGDKNLLSSRSVSWMQNKYGIEGNLYWDAAAYTDEEREYYNEYVNVYTIPYRSSVYKWPAGDGFLTYPGAAYDVYGPIPSMRLMSIRDGMEEYEILRDVEESYVEKFDAFSGTFSVDTTMESLFYQTLYSNGIEMNADGENALQFTAIRENLLSLAMNLDKGLGYAMSDIQISGNWLTGYKATFTCYVENGAELSINGKTVTSGSSYTTGKMSGDTFVTITVNHQGETATYTQYVGTASSLLNLATATTEETDSTENAVVFERSIDRTIQTYNAEEGTELLLSFDTYANITGTAIRVSKLFAQTKVNKDTQYITEGTGSWMITPEGDYGEATDYPWFRMRCTDTTFGSSNFFGYDKVIMDVYNAGDEAVSIQWKFTVYTTEETYVTTENVTYVLQPHTWTTCEYDLTDEVYSSYFDLTQVKYMTVTFLDKKVSREDTTSTIYMDNLRGLISERERQQTEVSYSFEEGVDFKRLLERYAFAANETSNAKMELSRVAYKDTSVAESASLFGFGEYGLMGDATESIWPGLTIRFEQEYSKDAVLSFWIYVAADQAIAKGQTYRMEAFTELKGTAHSVQNGNCEFNCWQEVKITLNEPTETLYFFVNLDDGTSASKLGDEIIHIYMDKFQIVTDSGWGGLYG